MNLLQLVVLYAALAGRFHHLFRPGALALA